jgi:imidazoleglycerol-phosphate dehydratase
LASNNLFGIAAVKPIYCFRKDEPGMRSGKIERKTAETEISVAVKLDGTGKYKINTGVGFFDHMLEQLARHSLIDLEIEANGDNHIDDHHTVEDAGIALGQALAQAVGDKVGINRYGWCLLPMDDTLIRTALDLSSRPFLYFDIDMPTEKIGDFDTELVREFFQAVSTHAGITLHMEKLHGYNSHHIAEAAFKSFSKSLRVAIEKDPRNLKALPSTKGAL